MRRFLSVILGTCPWSNLHFQRKILVLFCFVSSRAGIINQFEIERQVQKVNDHQSGQCCKRPNIETVMQDRAQLRQNVDKTNNWHQRQVIRNSAVGIWVFSLSFPFLFFLFFFSFPPFSFSCFASKVFFWGWPLRLWRNFSGSYHTSVK